jgi:hypothetical protein
LGVNSKSKKIQFAHVPSKEKSDRSKEMAMFFRTNRRVKLEKININIAYFNASKPVFVRFNIYDKNLKSVLNQDLFDVVTLEKIINDTYSFDISKKNIWLNNDFYVSIQILNNFDGGIYLCGGLLGNKTIYRKYLGNWEIIPVVSPAINIDVKVQK